MRETIRVDWLTANPRGCVYIRASLSRARESTAAPQTAAHASAAMRLGKRRFEAWPCAHKVSSRRALAGARHRATRLTCSPGRTARRAPSWRACERSAASLRPHRCVSSRALSAAARGCGHGTSTTASLSLSRESSRRLVSKPFHIVRAVSASPVHHKTFKMMHYVFRKHGHR